MNDNQQQNAGIYNGISILFLVLTLASIMFVVFRMASPPPEETVSPEVAAELAAGVPTLRPTVTASATATDTPTITPTLPPSFTPTPSDTPTPTISPTPTTTLSPTPTITDTPGPTLTPSDTPTPSISPTIPATPTSSEPTLTRTPTQSPFFFELRTDPQFIQNQQASGCAYQAIGGTVLGLDGLELPQQLQVRVIAPDVDRIRTTGSNSQYGPIAGFEVPVAQQILTQTYIVRLESLGGTQVAGDIQVSFPGDCLQNIAILTYTQIRPLPGSAG